MLPTSATYSTYGGEKTDYQPAEDDTTDLSAEDGDEARADTAAMTRMIGRAYVAFTYDGTTFSITDHDAVWGNDVSVKPTINGGSGMYLITWPTTVTDARGNTNPVNLRRGLGNCEQQTVVLSVARQSPNQFRVYASIAGGTGQDPTGVMVVVVW